MKQHQQDKPKKEYTFWIKFMLWNGVVALIGLFLLGFLLAGILL